MDIENLQRLDVRIVRGLDEHGTFVSPGIGDGFVLNQGPVHGDTGQLNAS